MKYLFATLCLSLSAVVFAQDSLVPKKVTCNSGTVRFSFEYGHSHFKSPSMINVKVPHSDAEKLIFDLYNSRLSPDSVNEPQSITLSAEGNTYLSRRFFKPKQDGSYSFSVIKKVDEDTAAGTLSFTSEQDGYQIVDHKVQCKVSEI